MAFNLTKKFWSSKLDKGRYFDSKIVDLYLRVGVKKRTFHLRFRCPDTGKRRELVLGPVDNFSREVLEETVATLKRRVMLGEQPGGKMRREKRQGKTMGAVFQRVFELLERDYQNQIAEGTTPKPSANTIAQYKKTYERELCCFEDVVLEDLTRKDVGDWYQRLLDTGKKGKANHALTVLRSLITKAQEYTLIDEAFSAAEKIKRPHYNPRGARDLSIDEAGMLWRYTESLDPVEKNTVRFQLLTVTRMRETVQAKWEDIDLEKGTWKTGTKTYRDKIVPLEVVLSDAAIKLLKAQKVANMHRLPDRNTPYVFPASKYARTKPYFDQVDRVLKAASEEMGVEHFSSHSLRKTGYTLMSREETGISERIVSMCAGHGKGDKIKEIYNQNKYREAKRAALNLLANEIIRSAQAKKEEVPGRDKKPESCTILNGPGRE